ncbi:hypothetical protein DFJ77DRAFT_509552 [Powellomyces hirtus]|nr:hypothetical protein DFJ77DRAFT_509552 [Powellomyces hirtus]
MLAQPSPSPSPSPSLPPLYSLPPEILLQVSHTTSPLSLAHSLTHSPPQQIATLLTPKPHHINPDSDSESASSASSASATSLLHLAHASPRLHATFATAAFTSLWRATVLAALPATLKPHHNHPDLLHRLIPRLPPTTRCNRHDNDNATPLAWMTMLQSLLLPPRSCLFCPPTATALHDDSNDDLAACKTCNATYCFPCLTDKVPYCCSCPDAWERFCPACCYTVFPACARCGLRACSFCERDVPTPVPVTRSLSTTKPCIDSITATLCSDCNIDSNLII